MQDERAHPIDSFVAVLSLYDVIKQLYGIAFGPFVWPLIIRDGKSDIAYGFTVLIFSSTVMWGCPSAGEASKQSMLT